MGMFVKNRKRKVTVWKSLFGKIGGRSLKDNVVGKKTGGDSGKCYKIIAELELPSGADSVVWRGKYIHDRKCRASQAIVKQLYIVSAKGTLVPMKDNFVGYSRFAPNFKYVKGTEIIPNFWDDKTTDQCSGGIHFFFRLEDALNW